MNGSGLTMRGLGRIVVSSQHRIKIAHCAVVRNIRIRQMAYQKPQIGHTPETSKRLTKMGWPNALLGASDGEIALAYAEWQDRKRDKEDTRLAVWTFWICMAAFVGMCVWLWLGAA